MYGRGSTARTREEKDLRLETSPGVYGVQQDDAAQALSGKTRMPRSASSSSCLTPKIEIISHGARERVNKICSILKREKVIVGQDTIVL